MVSAIRFASRFAPCDTELIANCATHNPLWHSYQVASYVSFLRTMFDRLVAESC